jgi:hypothetical protein
MKTPYSTLVRSAATVLLGAAAVLPATGSAFAADQTETLGPNIVANGGFETGSDPGVQLSIPVGSPYLTGWTTRGTEVKVMGTYWQPQEGTRSMALANYGQIPADPKIVAPSASGVLQTLTTKVGQQYRVAFYQAGNPYDHRPAVIRIQIGGVSKDFTYQSDTTAKPAKMQWVQRSFVYTATATSTPLALYAYYTPGNNALGLDNVQVRAIQSGPGAPTTVTPGKKTTLQVGSASLAAQGQQTVQVSTGKNAAVILVIDYPDGTQVAVPGHAGADGTYTHKWAVPTTVHGTVHLTVDSAGTVAQGTFKVS